MGLTVLFALQNLSKKENKRKGSMKNLITSRLEKQNKGETNINMTPIFKQKKKRGEKTIIKKIKKSLMLKKLNKDN